MLAMHDIQPLFIPAPTDKPRHAQQEVVDLLAGALLRLRALPATDAIPDREPVGLGFCGQQSVNVNPGHDHGVRP